ELDLADALMNTLGEVDLTDLHDEYREALEEVLAAKATGDTPRSLPDHARSGKVLDLMAALEKSVRDAKETRTEEAEVKPLRSPKKSPRSPKTPDPKKSTSTKRTTTKKTQTPRKSTSTKTTSEKATTKSTATTKKATRKRTTPQKRTA
ncbi:Ku protein, partial [Streptomyces sp. DSM 41014]|nr:Ku protein [Streptomyces sp. DSM 41014]